MLLRTIFHVFHNCRCISCATSGYAGPPLPVPNALMCVVVLVAKVLWSPTLCLKHIQSFPTRSPSSPPLLLSQHPQQCRQLPIPQLQRTPPSLLVSIPTVRCLNSKDFRKVSGWSQLYDNKDVKMLSAFQSMFRDAPLQTSAATSGHLSSCWNQSGHSFLTSDINKHFHPQYSL